MDALIHQFFNLDIMRSARCRWCCSGLQHDAAALRSIVIPLGLAGGLLFALASLSRARAPCAGA